MLLDSWTEAKHKRRNPALADRREANAMAPDPMQNEMSTQSSDVARVVGNPVAVCPYGESAEHLSFEEMREMPMSLALGFDTEE